MPLILITQPRSRSLRPSCRSIALKSLVPVLLFYRPDLAPIVIPGRRTAASPEAIF